MRSHAGQGRPGRTPTPAGGPAPGGGGRAAAVLRLQRQAGNAATAHLLGGLTVQRTTYQPRERDASRTSPGAAARHPPGPLPPHLVVLADFAAGGHDLKPAHLALLGRLLTGEGLAGRARLVSVVGYADGVGSAAGNARLRGLRAQAALAYLHGHELRGGTASPAPDGTYLAGNDSAEDRAGNRAVVIALEPLPIPAPPEPAGPEQPAAPAQPAGSTGPAMDGGVPEGPRDAGLPGGVTDGHPPGPEVRPPPPSPAPVEIDVGDDYDATGWLEGFFRTGEVYMSDVDSMVANVIRAAGDHPVARLDVRAHGSPTTILIGSDEVTVAGFGAYRPALARLAPHFTAAGFVHLESCTVGQNLPLLRLFAAAFGVRVYSATGLYNNILRFNTGDYVVCAPDGVCSPATRP
ncbi:hypothetical protein ACIQUQ_04480 [Streptomyces sp. NPDC101118]|uniref:hypothetical protein n=1 Tax=Streptomyces sp. NPDC101118 TaxID=3366109 RepID=UPI0038178F6D